MFIDVRCVLVPKAPEGRQVVTCVFSADAFFRLFSVLFLFRNIIAGIKRFNPW